MFKNVCRGFCTVLKKSKEARGKDSIINEGSLLMKEWCEDFVCLF
jgi:hypothetical protein